MELKNALSHSMGERNTEIDLIQSMIGNRTKFVFAAHVATDSSTVGTVYNPKKRIQVYAKDAADGNRHTWFQGNQVVIAGFGSLTGSPATITCTPATLTFTNGAAAATISIAAGSHYATMIDTYVWNVRTNHFHCAGESIATQHIWKWYFKQ